MVKVHKITCRLFSTCTITDRMPVSQAQLLKSWLNWYNKFIIPVISLIGRMCGLTVTADGLVTGERIIYNNRMDCITFNKDIDAYIRDELPDAELNDFLHHLSSCKKCAEELEINYIVSEGMKRMDKSDADFNLTLAFRNGIGESGKYIKMRKREINVANIVRTVMIWALIGTIVVYIRVSMLGA